MENLVTTNTMPITQAAPLSEHKLNCTWKLWAHLPHDVDWTVKSYKEIYRLNSIEETVVLFETIPDQMVKNCMLFVMRDGISPVWEDPKNRDGGCFSYKISHKTVASTWKQLAYTLVGETLAVNKMHDGIINGITISPKKNFSIIKIWLSDCSHQNPNIIKEVKDIALQGCLFKKHMPEY